MSKYLGKYKTELKELSSQSIEALLSNGSLDDFEKILKEDGVSYMIHVENNDGSSWIYSSKGACGGVYEHYSQHLIFPNTRDAFFLFLEEGNILFEGADGKFLKNKIQSDFYKMNILEKWDGKYHITYALAIHIREFLEVYYKTNKRNFDLYYSFEN